MSSCSSKQTPQNNPTPVTPPAPMISSGKPLTQNGENQMGRFSPDGTKIIYQSRSRIGHKGSQIYILNLANMRERRITYNDGDDFSPSFDSTGKYIFYSSTTDEMKEHPTGFPSSNIFAASPSEIVEPAANFEEIYHSDVDGSHIRRLTQSIGYDGSPSPSPDGRHTVFVSQRDGNFELYFMDAKGKSQSRIFKSTDVMAMPIFSPNGKLIAFESRPQGKNTVQIETIQVGGKTPVSITTHEGVNRDPSWTPDGNHIVFSSNRENENIFSIYMVKPDGTCLKRLTSPPDGFKSKNMADLHPIVSPDGKKLLYSSNRSGVYQLYMIDFQEPKDCLADKG
jgi:TolB protein